MNSSNDTPTPTLDNNLLQQLIRALQHPCANQQDDNMSVDRVDTDSYAKERREWIPTDNFIEDYAPDPLHDVEWILSRSDKSAIWDAAPRQKGAIYDAPDIPPILYQKMSKKGKLCDKDLAKIGTRAAMITRPLDYLASRIWRLQDKLDDRSYQELLLLASMTRTLVCDLTSLISQLKEDLKTLKKFKEFSADRRKNSNNSNQQQGNKKFGQQFQHKSRFNKYNNNNNNNNTSFKNSKNSNGSGGQERRTDA
ncbi:hypothetical protein FBU30_005267 [Linnemannia zychae]|nr:hypothetical protein FBU30_005267 [Linnemannia zychae]